MLLAAMLLLLSRCPWWSETPPLPQLNNAAQVIDYIADFFFFQRRRFAGRCESAIFDTYSW